MARKKNDDNPGENNTAWDEAGLSHLTREKLLEVAGEFEIVITGEVSDDEIIKLILEAQKEDTETSPEDTGNTPPADASGQGEAPDEKVRIKNEKCKGEKRFLGNGELVEFDANGIAEIEASQAERLLKIPGYEKV
jgi:hypothetical protein